MDNPKSVWIWANRIFISNTFWTSMNTFNNRGAKAITNAPGITSHAPLVSLYLVQNKKNNKYNNVLLYQIQRN